MSISFGTGYSLGPWRRDMLNRIRRGALKATDQAARGAQADIQSAMRVQQLGGLANAIKSTSDYRKGRIKERGNGGFSASGVVYPLIKSARTKGALEAYTEGATILPKKGRWLAIATNEIPRRAGRKRMTPELYVSTGLERRIGPLKFVPTRRANVAYLVVEDVTINTLRAGKARRLPKTGSVRAGRSRVGIIAFVLIRSTQRTARVDPQALARKWQLKLPSLWARAIDPQ